MFGSRQEKSSDIISELEKAINNCNYRIRTTEESIIKQKEANEKLLVYEQNANIAEMTLANLDVISKEVLKYNNNKKEKSMSAIYSAIYAARSIIGDTNNITLKVERDAAYLVNDRGDEGNLVEGSAFRAITSFFIRDVLLSNTDYIQWTLWDEPLATVSEENSATFSKFLPLLARDKQITLIEQKKEAFIADGIKTYHFKKTEGKTRVREVDI